MSAVYTPSGVARALRVSDENVRRAIRIGQLSAARVGAQYRLSPTDLAGWIGVDRYLELFSPLEDARQVLGSGGLSDDEAHALALEAVHAVRVGSTRLVEGPAPKRVLARSSSRKRPPDGGSRRPSAGYGAVQRNRGRVEASSSLLKQS